MTEEDYYSHMAEIESARLQLERQRTELESTFWRKHGVTIGCALVSLAGALVAAAIQRNADATQKNADATDVSARKIEAATRPPALSASAPALLNPAGTIGRSIATDQCSATGTIPLDVEQKFQMGLLGTTLRGAQSAHLRFQVGQAATTAEINVGATKLVDLGNPVIAQVMVTVFRVTECTAEYRVFSILNR